MYIDYKQMQSEIDANIAKGIPRLNADWMWMETQGAGRLEKRDEMGVEVEKFVVGDPQKFLDCQDTLQKFYYWKSKQNETL